MWYIPVILADVPACTMFIDIKTTQLTCTNPAETEQRRKKNWQRPLHRAKSHAEPSWRVTPRANPTLPKMREGRKEVLAP